MTILWSLIIGAVFYWMMRMGGCGAHGAGGHHGDEFCVRMPAREGEREGAQRRRRWRNLMTRNSDDGTTQLLF